MDEFEYMTPYEFSLKFFHFSYRQQLDWQRTRMVACAMGVKQSDIKLDIDHWFKSELPSKELSPEELAKFNDFASKVMSGEIQVRTMNSEDVLRIEKEN